MRTGKEAAEQQAQDLSDALGFIRTALLVFAAVALLVGGFLIFNTFTVTVAQRTKEFALLRVLGASRAQVLRSVLIETFAVGVFASILGVLVGIGLAPALAAMLKAFGIDLGTEGLVISPGTVVIGLIIGVLATMVSGFVPARRATRVEPVTAMRDAVLPGVGHLRRRRLVGSIALMGSACSRFLRALRRDRRDLGRGLAARPGRAADDVRRRVPGAAARAAAGSRARRADGAATCPASSPARTRSASRSAPRSPRRR